MNRYFKFSIATLLALTFLFACFFGWLTHERKPRVDELLYWDVTQGLKEYVVKEAECGIHSEEPGAFFLTFTCLASPDYGNDPYIEVSLLFSKDPTAAIVPGKVFPVVLQRNAHDTLQSMRYNSVWEDFENATITINSVAKGYIDATMTGIDGAGGGSKVSVRAKFRRIANMQRSFSLLENHCTGRITMR